MMQYLLIGEVIKPQGVRGEIKLRAESEDMSRYDRLQNVYVKNGEQFIQKRVLKGRANNGFAYLQIEGITDRNAAEMLRGKLIYVDRCDAIVLEKGKHFICDLIGCEAYDEKGSRIGILSDIQHPNPYYDIYVFNTFRGEMMMPALNRAIRKVDVLSKRMVLDAAVLEEIALWPDSQEVRED